MPKEVKVACVPARVEVTGPKGLLTYPLPQGISVSVNEGKILVHRGDDQRTTRALQGLTRSLIANMVTGVTKGFEQKLEIVGVGFRADLQGNTLKLAIGYSHPILYPVPKGIQVEVDKQTLITVKGIDRQQVVESLPPSFVRSNPLNPIKGRESDTSANESVRRLGRPKLKEKNCPIKPGRNILKDRKKLARAKRKKRVRSRVKGTSERPRLNVFRSLKLYAQTIEDSTGKTLVSASTLSPELKGSFRYPGNVEAAKKVGELIAKKCKADWRINSFASGSWTGRDPVSSQVPHRPVWQARSLSQPG